MLPLINVEARLMMGVCPDSRPPPAEFKEFFDTLVYVSRHALGSEYWAVPDLSALADALPGAQVFDFGEVAEPFLMKEAEIGGTLMNSGVLRSPYETSIYWYTLTDLLHSMPEMMTSDRVRYASVLHRLEDDTYIVADFMLLNAEANARIRAAVTLEGVSPPERNELARGSHMFLCSGIGKVTTRSESGKWGGTLLDNFGHGKGESHAQVALGSLADGIAALSMVLSTKGVRTRREAAPDKVNHKRLRAGKHAYPAVTYVDTREYMEAAVRTAGGGTHASPVPHLRRGHTRTYQDGRQVWVRSALVNCRSPEEAASRDHYEVRR